MCHNFDPEKKVVEEDEPVSKEGVDESLDDSVEIISDNENEGDEDDIWDNMVVINSSSKRKQKPDQNVKRKKVK